MGPGYWSWNGARVFPKECARGLNTRFVVREGLMFMTNWDSTLSHLRHRFGNTK